MSNLPNAESMINEHLKTILLSLKDNDISIRRRALDILYLMCTPSTANRIVDELLKFTEDADLQIKEELVLKIAILTENFADNLLWYIDTVVKLVSTSGDYITEDIWYRIIQIITGFGKDQEPELQKYAALKVYAALNIPHVHETLVKIGSYILSEYGRLIVDSNKTPEKIFDVLNRHFVNLSTPGKAMLLTSFVKLGNIFPDLRDTVQGILEIHAEHWDPDLQQRAVEYLQLMKDEKDLDEVRENVLQKMPCYSENIQENNPLLKRIYLLKMGTNAKDSSLSVEAKKQIESNMEMFKSKSSAAQNMKSTSSNPSQAQAAAFGTSSGTKVNAPPPQATSTSSSLLDTDLLGDSSSSGGGGTAVNLKSHPLFATCQSKIAVDVANILPIPDPIKSSFANYTEFKTLITSTTGVLISNQSIQIDYKSEYQGNLARIAMQFVSKSGQALTNIAMQVVNAPHLQMQISPVKYEDNPKCMIQALAIGASAAIPTLQLIYLQGDQKNAIELAFPVTVNKFINSIDMPLPNFTKFWDEYTTVTNQSYYRIDNFIKNPAPAGVPVTEVMKKVGALLNNGLGLKANGLPDMTNLKEIYAAAQYSFKPENAANPVNFPIMIQAEGFSENPAFLRLSLRGAGSPEVIKGMYAIIMAFLGV